MDSSKGDAENPTVLIIQHSGADVKPQPPFDAADGDKEARRGLAPLTFANRLVTVQDPVTRRSTVVKFPRSMARAAQAAHPLPRRVAVLVLLLAAAGCDHSTEPRTLPPASITITPGAVELVDTDTVRLAARLTASDGSVVSGGRITWKSTDPGLVTVDSAGLARGVGWSTGTAMIVASMDSLADTVAVQAVHRLQPDEALNVWPDTNVLLPGMQRRPTARGITIDGVIRSLIDVQWRSTDPAVLTVDAAGTVTAVAPGHAAVVAAVGARESRAEVFVRTYPAPLRFASVATGRFGFDNQVCGLTLDGEAYCWGNGSHGSTDVTDRCEQFGYSSHGLTYWVRKRCALIPVRVPAPERFVGLSVDDYSTCAWTAAGTPYCWGTGADGVVPLGGGVTFRTISRQCGIGTDDLLYCWGSNLRDRLGAGPGAPTTPTPVRVKSDLQWRSVSSASSKACAVAVDGRAFCWGWNSYGSLGVVTPDTSAACSTTECVSAPTAVATSERFTAVKVAETHACGLTTDGRLYCWGGTFYAHALPVTRVDTDVRLASLDREGDVCGVTAAGDAYCIMFNEYQAAPSFALAPVASGMKFRSADPGKEFTCGIALDGLAYCVGGGPTGNGAVGSGTPVLVAGQQ
jgi:hypothetical protein